MVTPRPRHLRDRIRPGVRVLFVGINPGIRSATIGHHFAGYSNRFWKLLFDSGLVSAPLQCEHDACLPRWGYGLTNLVARPSAGMSELRPEEYGAGRRRLLAKISQYRPKVVALVGVTLYTALFPKARRRPAPGRTQGRVRFGPKAETLAGARVFLLPNPSGRNASYSYRQMLEAFRALKRYLQGHHTEQSKKSQRKSDPSLL